MKLKVMKMAYVAMGCIFAMSCSTSDFVENPVNPIGEEESQGKEVTLNFRIMQNSYTRATDEDIDNLYLAFYNIDGSTKTFLRLEEVDLSSSSDVFTTKIDVTDTTPNAVVAYANITDESLLKNALYYNTRTATTLTNGSGSYVMTSARYYNSDGTDIYYSPITDSNINDGVVVNIYLERIAAKVTVTNNMSTNPTISAFGYNSENGNFDRELTLTLTGWNVSGTDKETYLLKNNGGLTYSEMETALGSNSDDNWLWNSVDNHSLNWAQSVNWGATESSFPAAGSESGDAIANFLTSSDVTNSFGGSAIFNETTRPTSLYNTPNALPSVILEGKYTSGDSNEAVTLYRNGNLFLTYDELVQYFVYKNTADAKIIPTGSDNSYSGMYWKNGSYILFSYKEMSFFLKYYAELTSPDSNSPNFVTMQIKSDASIPINSLCTADGVDVDASLYPTINENLVEVMGLWEVYDGGKCFFHIPIEHKGKSTDPDGTRTGSYGLVRNHHYNITISSIAGIGIGMPASGYIGEWEYPSNPDVRDVNYSVSVNEWNNVSQDINISEKK